MFDLPFREKSLINERQRGNNGYIQHGFYLVELFVGHRQLRPDELAKSSRLEQERN